LYLTSGKENRRYFFSFHFILLGQRKHCDGQNRQQQTVQQFDNDGKIDTNQDNKKRPKKISISALTKGIKQGMK